MADLKDQTICMKFCFNLEKTASETYARTQTFEFYSSLRSGQNLIGILNVHIAHGHVRLNKIWNSSHPSLHSSEWGCSSRPNCLDFGRKCPNKWGTQTGFFIMAISCWKALGLCTSGSDVHLSVYLTSLNPYTVPSQLFKVPLCSSWWTLVKVLSMFGRHFSCSVYICVHKCLSGITVLSLQQRRDHNVNGNVVL
jgi:hypothetical protein